MQYQFLFSCNKIKNKELNSKSQNSKIYHYNKTDDPVLDSLDILKYGLVNLQNNPAFITQLDSIFQIGDADVVYLKDLDSMLTLNGYNLVDSMKKSVAEWGNASDTSLVQNLIAGINVTSDSTIIPYLYIPFGFMVNLNKNAGFFATDGWNPSNYDTTLIQISRLNSDGSSLENFNADSLYASNNPVWTLSVISPQDISIGIRPEVSLFWVRCYCSRGTRHVDAGHNVIWTTAGTCSEYHQAYVDDKAGAFCGISNFNAECSGHWCPGS